MAFLIAPPNESSGVTDHSVVVVSWSGYIPDYPGISFLAVPECVCPPAPPGGDESSYAYIK